MKHTENKTTYKTKTNITIEKMTDKRKIELLNDLVVAFIARDITQGSDKLSDKAKEDYLITDTAIIQHHMDELMKTGHDLFEKPNNTYKVKIEEEE